MNAVAELLEKPLGYGRQVLAQSDLLLFTQRMFPEYQVADHHKRVAIALQAIEAGHIDRLVISMPPRHGKSELASVHFPAWFLGRNPDQRIIAASYASGLAYRFSRRARNLMAHPLWPFPITTAGDLANVQSWDIEGHRGGYYAAGVGGGIAGHGADVLLIDDPVRSAEEADSTTYRERAWEWFTQDAVTRLEPGGRIVLIGTRWHEDDVIGRALASEEDWHHITLPAINDAGEALWPERFDIDVLLRIKSQIGSRAFEALYQQRPSPAEGAILKRDWWRYWERPIPEMQWIVQSWDTAFKVGKENDYSVCVTMGLAGQGMYVLDVYRQKVEFPALRRAVYDQYAKWRPDEILVEDKASGQSLVQDLGPSVGAELNPPPSGPPLPLLPFDPGTRDKLERAHKASPYLEGGRQFLPAEPTAWRDDFIEELAAFPAGTHDDQVDAYTQATLRLASRSKVMGEVDPGIIDAAFGLPWAPQW